MQWPFRRQPKRLVMNRRLLSNTSFFLGKENETDERLSMLFMKYVGIKQQLIDDLTKEPCVPLFLVVHTPKHYDDTYHFFGLFWLEKSRSLYEIHHIGGMDEVVTEKHILAQKTNLKALRVRMDKDHLGDDVEGRDFRHEMHDALCFLEMTHEMKHVQKAGHRPGRKM